MSAEKEQVASGVGATLRGLGGTVFVAVRSFFGTMIFMTWLGQVVARGTFFFAGPHDYWYGVIGAIVAALDAVIVAVARACKRPVVMALVYALRRKA